MKKLVFALLTTLSLVTACNSRQAVPNPQVPPTQTPPISLTPIPPTDSPVATASPQQPAALRISRFQMIDANVGWAEGSVTSEHDPSRSSETSYYLLRTTDGGETWQDVTPPFDSPRFFNVTTLFAIDADTAWAVPPGFPFSEDPPYIVVWRTTDGGKSWKPSNPVDISDSPIRDAAPLLQFVDNKHGWLTLRFEHRVQAYYLEFRSSDGGVTWEQMGRCSTYDGDLVGRCAVPEFTDAQTGWRTTPPVFTPTGALDPASTWRVERTWDGGQTWQMVTLPHLQGEKECDLWPTRVAMGIVGIYVNCHTPALIQESYYYLSADRGQTWWVLPQPEGANVVFLDMTTGWRDSQSANGYRLEKTTDGGETWQEVADGLPKGSFQFVDATAGWEEINAVSDPVDPIEMQRTTDGGKTWQKFSPRLLPAEPGRPAIVRLETGHPLVFRTVQMIDSRNGWALGANGYVFHTTDAGKAWQDITPLEGYVVPRRELFALDALRAWTTVTFPTHQTIWSTTDGGRSWQQMIALSEGQVVSPGSLRFLNEITGWFQSSEGGETQVVQLMKTQDQGVNWEVQSIGQYSHYVRDRMGFLFLDEQNGFRIEQVGEHTIGEFLSDSPALLSKTTDGGNNWQPVSLPPMLLDAETISLDQKAYPGGFQELMRDPLSCEPGITLRAFAPNTIGLRALCRGAYREVYGTYGYVFVLSEYYLSTDSGATWNNWVSFADDVPREADQDPIESEFFLPGGIGWRLKANQLLQTTDGGKTWTTLKAVGWEEARFDFIDTQEGWGLGKSGHMISLVHTTDGGQTWEEMKPVIAP